MRLLLRSQSSQKARSPNLKISSRVIPPKYSHNKNLELIDKLESKKDQSFELYKTLKAHILPLTHCAFNKNGDR